METTRHFVTTVFLVCDKEVAFHEHKKLGLLLPPGGHINRDELPHKAGEREVYEETGIEISLGEVDREDGYAASRIIPEPKHLLLDDITMKNQEPAHQHINLVYFAEVDHKTIDPQGDSEVDSENWYWFDVEDLEKEDNLPIEIDEMTKELAIEAVDCFSN